MDTHTTKSANLYLLLAIFIVATLSLHRVSFAQQPQSDPFVQGGCWEKSAATQLLQQHNGKILWKLEGNTLIEQYGRGTNPRIYTFVQYGVSDNTVFAVFREDQPINMSPTKICLWLHNASGQGTISNPSPGKPPARNILKEHPREPVLNSCVASRKWVLERLDNQLSSVGGILSSGKQMDRMADLLKSPEEIQARRRKDAEEIARANREGDHFCDRFREIVDDQARRVDNKLIWLMPVDEYKPGEGPIAKGAIFAVFVNDPVLYNDINGGLLIGWDIYSVEPNIGAAYYFGGGGKYTINPKVFEP
ncbi:MAG TPA: hypothetical protein PKE23_10260 [Anaerolineales bacterium]|nr:hypothetical protein [Anaerolineales bacterium]